MNQQYLTHLASSVLNHNQEFATEHYAPQLTELKPLFF